MMKSVKITKLIRYDFREGFRQSGIWTAGVIMITFFSCVELYMKIKSYNAIHIIKIDQASAADYLCFLLEGMHPFRPKLERSFIIPARWLLFHLYLLYAVLYYPYRDLVQTVGEKLVVFSGSRKKWWISKCIWSACYILLLYLFAIFSILIFGYFTGAKLNAAVTPQMMQELMDVKTTQQFFPLEFSALLLILPLFTTMAFAFFQMALGLLMKPLFAYGITVAFYVAAAYFDNTIFVGNYAMPIRSVYFMENGFTMSEGISAMLIIGIAAVVLGIFLFSRHDIMKLSEM